jgi:hypothetical protein
MRATAAILSGLFVQTVAMNFTAHAQSLPQIATLEGTVTLAAVVSACEQTASASQAGAVIIKGKVQDADCSATLSVPCAVQLDGRASLKLTNCTLQSQTLNVSDSASSAGSNAVKLNKVTCIGQASAGLLVRLTDPRDKIIIASSSVSYPRGIVLQASGARTSPDEGGKVTVRKSTLTTGGVGAGISISASTHRGKVSIANSPLTAPAVLVADRCRTVTDGKRTDCRAATLAADLARQAHDVTGD